MENLYQIIILSVLSFGFLAIACPNFIFLRNRKTQVPTLLSIPKISILIPARNEESHITSTLESILKESYANYEILVLDDQSSDKTAEIVKHFASRYPNIRYLKGKALPPGWTGKNFACHQLAEEAQGDYFLFTDADTDFQPGLLEKSLKCCLSKKTDLLTGFPRLWSPSFWGRLIVPNVYFIFLGFLPLRHLSNNRFPIISMGSGVFLFFKKESYLKAGGHSSIKSLINEDMALALNIKKAGLRLDCIDVSKYVASKMYDNFGEIWHGYSKNLFKALLSNYFLWAGFLIGYFLLFVMPFYFIFHFLFIAPNHAAFLLVMIQVLLILLFRSLIAVKFKQSGLSIWLHPLSISLMLLIGLRSGLLGIKPRGYQWKGRRYN